MPSCSRRYIESKQRLEAKLFKPFLSYVGHSFTIKYHINAPKRFTLELHEDYGAALV